MCPIRNDALQDQVSVERHRVMVNDFQLPITIQTYTPLFCRISEAVVHACTPFCPLLRTNAVVRLTIVIDSSSIAAAIFTNKDNNPSIQQQLHQTAFYGMSAISFADHPQQLQRTLDRFEMALRDDLALLMYRLEQIHS